MKRTSIQRPLIIVSTIALAVVVLVAAVAYSSVFLPVRQAIAQSLLSKSLKRTVSIRGPVHFDFGRFLEVAVEDAIVGDNVLLPDGQYIKSLSIRLGYRSIIGIRGSMSRLHASGASLEIAPQADKQASTTPVDFAAALSGLPTFLSRPLAADILLSDVTFRYNNPRNGFDEELTIQRFRTEPDPSGKQIGADLQATINGSPLKLTGLLTPVTESGAESPFELNAEMAGLTVSIEGSLTAADPIGRIDANLQAKSGSLGDLLDALGLERELEGTGDISAVLGGPLDKIALTSLETHIVDDTDNRYALTGKIDNLAAGQGIDLKFAVDFSPKAPSTDKTNTLVDIEILGVDGILQGNGSDLAVRKAHVKTDVATIGLDEIGPVEIGRIFKDEKGRIGLADIRILDGPPNAPYLDIEGRIGDVLSFSSMAFSGKFNLPTLALIGVEIDEPEKFGELVGTLSLSDKDGQFGIDQLEAKIEKTEFATLELELSVTELRRLNDLLFNVLFDVPDLGTAAKALNLPLSSPVGHVGFEGTVKLAEGSSLSAAGAGTVQNSAFNIDLVATATETGELVKGSIGSKRINLSDFAGLIEFISGLPKPQIDVISLDEDAFAGTRVELDLDIAKLTDGKKTTGKIVGRVTYEKNVVMLDPFSLAYLGGTISGKFGADFGRKSPRISAKGRINKFRLASFLKELGTAAPVTGTLNVSFGLSTSDSSVSAMVKSLNGQMTASVWGGSIPGRILDLTGLNLVTWLFAANADQKNSKLVCAVMPLRFKNGNASSSRLIIETENVQIVGGGSINFRSEKLDLSFAPRPKRQQVVELVTPFSITGSFGNPVVKAKGSGARAAAEVITLPLNLIGQLFTGKKPVNKTHKPCVLPKNKGAK